MMVGYWGIPGSGRDGSQVHIYAGPHKALCGDRFVERSEFQWCAKNNDLGLYMVECRRCKRKWLGRLAKIARVD